MNKEVSEWMRDPSENDSTIQIPFIATRGYDSVVWNRLYSRDSPDLMDYEAKQVNILKKIVPCVINRKVLCGVNRKHDIYSSPLFKLKILYGQ